ncbi:MAG: transglutaminase domain-containing protein [Planctomycetota bacterium]
MSRYIALFQKDHWIPPLVIGLQVYFVGITFRSLPALAVMFAVATMLAWLQRDHWDQSKPNLDTPSVRLDGSWNRTLWEIGRYLAVSLGFALLFLVVIGLTAAWRVAPGVSSASPWSLALAIDVLAHASLSMLLLLWILRPRRGHVAMLPLGMTLVVSCVSGGVVSRLVTAQITAAIVTCLGFVLASRWIVSADQRPRLGASDLTIGGERKSQTSWIVPVIGLLTISLLFMVTSVIARGTQNSLADIQALLQERITDSIESVDPNLRIGMGRYVSGGSIGSIRSNLLEQPDATALRIYSDDPPGYLRGSVFSYYENSHWNKRAPRGRSQRAFVDDYREVEPNGASSMPMLRRFDLATSIEQLERRTAELRIEGIPEKGTLVFTPMNYQWVEADSERLAISPDHLIRPGCIRIEQPYILGATPDGDVENLSSVRRRDMSRLSQSIAGIIRRYARSLFNEGDSAREKARLVSRHFQTKYQYSLDPISRPARTDPIAHFLATNHPAHCEYFATATTLLLRAGGVPARYVTGYVASERNDDDDYWIARNRDAHAWVEAYDDASQTWFAVESTPGRAYQTVTLPTDESELEGLLDDLDDSALVGSDSIWQRLSGWLSTLRLGDAFVTTLQLAQWPLFCFLIVVLIVRIRKSANRGLDLADQKSIRMLKGVEKRVRRELAISREPFETLHQFAYRIDGPHSAADGASVHAEAAKRKSLANWLRHYALRRYQGQQPEPYRA